MAIALLVLGNVAVARESPTVLRTTTLSALFPADKAKSLASTFPPDKPLHYRVRIPPNAAASGVLVFVKTVDSGEMPRNWAAELDRQNLIWISAEGFGNERPRSKRILAAIAGLKLMESTEKIDAKRLYIGGISGGGRIASQIVTQVPQNFTGALFIVGADFWTADEKPFLPRIAANRYVFVTGSRDFNQRSMKQMFSRYRSAGVTQALLMDLPGFGHEYPNAEQLGQALDFLDAR